MNEWSQLTWQELRERRAQDPLVILPIGCVETQGNHIPVGFEVILAERLADAVAAELHGLRLPVLPFGNSDAFRDIPGTIFIQPETLTAIYTDILESIVRSGFTHILCIAMHEPNQSMIERAARLVSDRTGVRPVWVNPGKLAAGLLPELFPDPKVVRGHGAEPAASLARYLTRFVETHGDEAGEEPDPAIAAFDVVGAFLQIDGIAVGYPLRWNELYPVRGGYGDASQGSVTIGQQMFERLVDMLVQVGRAVLDSPSSRDR